MILISDEHGCASCIVGHYKTIKTTFTTQCIDCCKTEFLLFILDCLPCILQHHFLSQVGIISFILALYFVTKKGKNITIDNVEDHSNSLEAETTDNSSTNEKDISRTPVTPPRSNKKSPKKASSRKKIPIDENALSKESNIPTNLENVVTPKKSTTKSKTLVEPKKEAELDTSESTIDNKSVQPKETEMGTFKSPIGVRRSARLARKRE